MPHSARTTSADDLRIVPLTELEVHQLSGTWPLRPFGERFYGNVVHDGQRTRVAAVCCDQPDSGADPPGLVLLSLVGASTSGSAALAQLADGRDILFEPAPDVTWDGPRSLVRLKWNYRQVARGLPGVTELHFLAFPLGMHIEDALLHPPELPAPPEDERGDEDSEGEGAAEGEGEPEAASPKEPPGPRLTVKDGQLSATAVVPPRYLLGNADETTPHRLSFLGHLVGLRIMFIPDWTEQLWALGLANGLIAPLQALGCRAWRISGDIGLWSLMISKEVAGGHLVGGGASA
jgi:hypothetical protein